jgi:WD40 repeat protein
MAFTQLGSCHQEGISSLTFDGAGAHLCSTSLDGVVAVWAVAETTAPVLVLRGHSSAVNTATYFADGVRLVTAGEDDAALLWDLRNPSAPWGRLTGVGAGVNRVALSGDEALVYAAGDDGSVTVHDLVNGTVIDRFVAAGAAINDLHVVTGALGNNLDLLLTATEDGALRTWVGGSADLATLYRQSHPRAMPDPDAEFDVEDDEDPEAVAAMRARVNEAAAGQMARFIDSIDEFEMATNHVHVRADYVFVASAACVFGLRIDATTGEMDREEAVTYAEHEDYIRGICTTSSGSMYTAGDDRLVVEWQPPQVAAVRRLQVHDDMVMALALSPLENILATGCEDSTIRLWNLPFGTQQR